MRGIFVDHSFPCKVQLSKGLEALVLVETGWWCCDWSAWLKKMPEKQNCEEGKNSFSFLQGTPEGDHEEDDGEDAGEELSFRM